jgi:dephospho-CoA kinase
MGAEHAERGILVITGASGAGKTTAVRALEARGRPGVRCFEFDSIGIPSADVMDRDFGGPEAWQADATKRWIARLVPETVSGQISILDGQTRPTFVLAALPLSENVHLRIVLVECSSDARRVRLTERGQPEAATPTMENWAAYLRGQADALGLSVIDSTSSPVAAVADRLEDEVAALRGSMGAKTVGRVTPSDADDGVSAANFSSGDWRFLRARR